VQGEGDPNFVLGYLFGEAAASSLRLRPASLQPRGGIEKMHEGIKNGRVLPKVFSTAETSLEKVFTEKGAILGTGYH
jgi:hypothetical protein